MCLKNIKILEVFPNEDNFGLHVFKIKFEIVIILLVTLIIRKILLNQEYIALGDLHLILISPFKKKNRLINICVAVV